MSDSQLYRSSAVAGLLAAAILVINVLRRAGVLPADAITHAVAPFSPTAALLAVTGLYLWQRERTGRLGALGYLLSMAGFAGAVGLEVTTQFIFAQLPDAQVDQLVDGPAKLPFAVIGVIFSLGATLFGVAMYRAAMLPRPAVALYAVSLTCFAWRTLMPDALVVLNGVLCAVAIVWLTRALWIAQGAGQGNVVRQENWVAAGR